MIEHIDLIKYHLHYVNCYIDGTKITKGLIYVRERKAYILQNKKDGTYISRIILKKYGFAFAWYVDINVHNIEVLGIYESLNQWWWN